ncbi:hypothetical protein H2204_005056 [Knufia peltigerae]|uniref:Uncharacterized protein n=1 Tax=Knufia peltigerae TaxID=1002370 RepID=A0AA38Y624_9EURO|nr:hypothetical protein H2204_005056 [Knufia peltigerae]
MASERPIAPRLPHLWIPPAALEKLPPRPTPLPRRLALAEALESLDLPRAIIPCAPCERNGNACYFCPERTTKCTSCIRAERQCIGRFDMERFRCILGQKRCLQDRSHELLTVLNRFRDAAIKAQAELLKAEMASNEHPSKGSRRLTLCRGVAINAQRDLSRAEADYNSIQMGMSALDDTSRTMLLRDMQSLGVLYGEPPLNAGTPDQNFAWMFVPGQESFCPVTNPLAPAAVVGGAAVPLLYQSSNPAGGFPPALDTTAVPGAAPAGGSPAGPGGEVPGGQLPSDLTHTGLAGEAAGPSKGSTSPAIYYTPTSSAGQQSLLSSSPAADITPDGLVGNQQAPPSPPAVSYPTPQCFADHQHLFSLPAPDSSSWAANTTPDFSAEQQRLSLSSWRTSLIHEGFVQQQSLSSSSVANLTHNASVEEQASPLPPSPIVSYPTPQSFADHQLLFSLPAPDRRTSTPAKPRKANKSALQTQTPMSGTSANWRHAQSSGTGSRPQSSRPEQKRRQKEVR